MSSKMCYFFIALISFQACQISGRFVQDDSSSQGELSNSQGLSQSTLERTSRNLVPGKALSDEEIEQMKQEMSKELTPIQLEKFGEILSKFRTGTSTKDHVDGMVQLLIFAVAARSNATDTEIQKLFGEDIQTTTVNAITLNNHI